jgi:ribonuclease R
MKRHIDECFDASVSSVTAHGAFLALDNTCEGFLPIEELGGRFYFDERSLSLRWGECSYTIGDRVKIRVESVDLATLAVRLSLAEEE